MRILFTRQQPLEAPGGETSHLFALAHQMQAIGIEVYIMPVTDHPTPKEVWPEEYIREIRPFGIHHLFDSFVLSKAVESFIKKTPVDAVLSWQYETAYLLNTTYSQPFVNGVIAAAPFGFLKQKATTDPIRAIAYHFFQFRMLRKADVVYCGSQFARDELINQIGLSPEKVILIPIGVDEIFQPSPKPKSGPVQKFIFCGSLEPIKGIFDTIEALAIIWQRGYQDWQLKVAGWGDDFKIRQFAYSHGIGENIRFLGILDRTNLAAEFVQADVAIMPSHTETFGLSIAEAQACSLPVVSYRTGAIPEVVVDGMTGLLVDLFDCTQLADAIIQMINDPEAAYAMGIKGQEFIRENFSWKRTAEQMIESINKLNKL
jgi:glycosyltransferase involved in cell wall biosynthesis